MYDFVEVEKNCSKKLGLDCGLIIPMVVDYSIFASLTFCCLFFNYLDPEYGVRLQT